MVTMQRKWTPLLHASHNGHVELVKVLLERGADPNWKSTVSDLWLHQLPNTLGSSSTRGWKGYMLKWGMLKILYLHVQFWIVGLGMLVCDTLRPLLMYDQEYKHHQTSIRGGTAITGIPSVWLYTFNAWYRSIQYTLPFYYVFFVWCNCCSIESCQGV